MLRSPGCDKLTRGRNAKPANPRPYEKSQRQPEGERADVEERRRKRWHTELIARVQHAHRLSRQRHQQQKREHDAREFDGQLEFSGDFREAGSQQLNERRAEDHA
jgi:hypothetical protein